MLADVLQEILRSAADARYNRPDGDPIKLVIALDNGSVYRGHLVSFEEWLEINSIDRTSPGWVGGRERPVRGSWPKAITDPDVLTRIREKEKAAASEEEADITHTMIFMTMVEFLSGDRWVSGSSMATDAKKVVACGEQYH